MVTIPFAALVVLMDEHRDAILINPVKSFNTQVSHPPALKGQKLLAQGSALGIMANSKAPCKGKSFMSCWEF